MPFSKELVATTQGRMADLGYYTGKIDGLAGPMTENAMIDFKEANGFRGRPFPGPLTMAALWSPDAEERPKPKGIKGEPSWLTEARRLLGTREVAGPGNNPVIMKWARDLDQWYPGDDVAWCGLFVAHCMSIGAPDESQDFNRLGARSWLKFGKKCGPKLGSICILWRTHPTRSWHGHVFFPTAINDTHIRGIGGNQSNNVTETWFPRSRVLGFVCPDDFDGGELPTAKTGKLSTTEA